MCLGYEIAAGDYDLYAIYHENVGGRVTYLCCDLTEAEAKRIIAALELYDRIEPLKEPHSYPPISQIKTGEKVRVENVEYRCIPCACGLYNSSHGLMFLRLNDNVCCGLDPSVTCERIPE